MKYLVIPCVAVGADALAVYVTLFPKQGAKLPEEEVMTVTAGGKKTLESTAVLAVLTEQVFTDCTCKVSAVNPLRNLTRTAVSPNPVGLI